MHTLAVTTPVQDRLGLSPNPLSSHQTRNNRIVGLDHSLVLPRPFSSLEQRARALR